MLHVFIIRVVIHYKCVVRFDFNDILSSISDINIILRTNFYEHLSYCLYTGPKWIQILHVWNIISGIQVCHLYHQQNQEEVRNYI